MTTTNNPPKILMVDDDAVNGLILEGYLRDDNYELHFVDNGQEALETATELNPDLILLDIAMPGMSGFEVCEILKNDEATQDIPVLFLTALSQKDTHKKAIESGAEGFIVKPFSEGLVRAYVKTFVRIKQTYDNTKHGLQESTEKFGSLVENVPIGISISTKEGVVTDANPAAIKIFGYDSKEDFFKVPASHHYYDPKDREKYIELLEKDLVKDFEIRFKKKNGTMFWSSLTSISQMTKSGGPQYINAFQDITECKHAEQVKKKLEARLQQAQKMEAIGTLAGGIAHDFNNILTAVIGYTELALNNVPKKTLLESNLNQVLKAGYRAKYLVKQILTFSRQTEPETGPVQVKLIVNEVIELLRASLPTTIEIRQDIQNDSTVLSDPTQIHQILMNLCTNAGHAMRERGGTLEVSLTNVELDSEFTGRYPDMAPGPYLRLTVGDTGIGMTPDVLERVFDPFFTTKGRSEGTGMGLSVVHGIVKSYGGTIAVYSEPGKGSTFHVYLPVTEPLRDKVQTESRLGGIPTGNERILFIDDEPCLVDMGKQTLVRFMLLSKQVKNLKTSDIQIKSAMKKPLWNS